MNGGSQSLTKAPKKVIHMKDPSALRYQNRLGDIYYLQRGTTSAGKMVEAHAKHLGSESFFEQL
jgi:hypothetical protein